MSFCLFKPCFCLFMCIISDINLLLYEDFVQYLHFISFKIVIEIYTVKSEITMENPFFYWYLKYAIIFNSLYTKLQFTMEVGNDNRLNFLDTTVIIDNKRIIFDTYHKTTFSGRFLDFHSNHPLCHKKGIIISFVDKIFLLSQNISVILGFNITILLKLFIFFLIMAILSLLFFPQLKTD